MDILKKMFGKNEEHKGEAHSPNEFRKPSWFEDDEETDDELFDNNRQFVFQMFTNPFELQKYFDQQMQEVLKTLKEYEDESNNFDRNLKDEYLKPGFEENLFKDFKKRSKTLDTDLDGEIYADQLHSLMQRLPPEMKSIISENKKKLKTLKPKEKLSDEELIMAKIHGTIEDEDKNPAIRRKDTIIPKLAPHFGGVFEGTYQGPKMFGQSIMSQTIRKPDGSYETKKIIRDTTGNVKTTITRTVDGKTETVTTYGNGDETKTATPPALESEQSTYSLQSDRNIYISKSGYALPKNLW